MTGTSAGDRLLWSSVPSVVLLLCDESGSLWFYSHLTSRFGNYFTAIVCTELVRALVSIPDDQPEKSVHQRGDNGFTVLGRACMADGPESVKLLLDVGSNPTLMAYIPGSVCLMHVTHQLSTDSAGVVMIRLLIQYGAKLDTSDDEGLTTLTRAAARGNLQMCQSLVKIDIKPSLGQNAISFAAIHGKIDVVRLLLRSGASERPPSAVKSGKWQDFVFDERVTPELKAEILTLLCSAVNTAGRDDETPLAAS